VVRWNPTPYRIIETLMVHGARLPNFPSFCAISVCRRRPFDMGLDYYVSKIIFSPRFFCLLFFRENFITGTRLPDEIEKNSHSRRMPAENDYDWYHIRRIKILPSGGWLESPNPYRSLRLVRYWFNGALVHAFE
jgi:hypothetical protein